MNRYALVNIATALVENICVWDGESPWTPPEGCEAAVIPADQPVGIGYFYSKGVFVPPAKPVEELVAELAVEPLVAKPQATP
jgi:hypothetical protein